MPSFMTVPHLAHLVGLASPQMSTPTALRGPCSWGDEAGVPAARALCSEMIIYSASPGDYIYGCSGGKMMMTGDSR